MKKSTKKLISIFLTITMFVVSASSACAIEQSQPDTTSGITLTDALSGEEDGFLYDGKTEVLLGTYTETPAASQGSTSITPYGYFEYDRWKVYDQGITKKWVYLSRPYFIISVARGMTYKESEEITVSATISAEFGSGIPSAAKSKVKSAFKLNASGSKKVKREITLSGPGKGYSSRDFYYKKGRHRHKIKIVKEHVASEGIGVVSTKTYYSTVDDPAIKCYSEDTN